MHRQYQKQEHQIDMSAPHEPNYCVLPVLSKRIQNLNSRFNKKVQTFLKPILETFEDLFSDISRRNWFVLLFFDSLKIVIISGV